MNMTLTLSDADILEATKDWAPDEMATCVGCGKEYTYVKYSDGRNRSYCTPECRDENRAPKPKKKYQSATREGTTITQYYILLKDQLTIKDGGFRPGSVFHTDDVNQMLLDRVLSNGSILWCVSSETLYVVEYGDE